MAQSLSLAEVRNGTGFAKSTRFVPIVSPVYRVRFVYDQDAQFEESNGEPRPLTETEYADNEYMANGQTIPYAEYLRYYGNPDRHVYLGCIIERQCPCCEAWKPTGVSLWDIDFMDDSPELAAIQIDRPIAAHLARVLPGYAGDVARELLDEVTHHD